MKKIPLYVANDPDDGYAPPVAGTFQVSAGDGPRRVGRISAPKTRYFLTAYTERNAEPPDARFHEAGKFANPSLPKQWRFITTNRAECKKAVRALKQKGFVDVLDVDAMAKSNDVAGLLDIGRVS